MLAVLILSAMFVADQIDDLMAIPGLAQRVGVSPRVLRYWEEQGLISPSTEHGRLRYGPRDEAIARLVRRLMESSGYGVDAVRMLRLLAEEEVRGAAEDETRRLVAALRLLYARKRFRELTGVDEERLLAPPPPGLPPGPPPGPLPGRFPGPRQGAAAGRHTVRRP
jgi:DNA-binding transcriptional MerR regulator